MCNNTCHIIFVAVNFVLFFRLYLFRRRERKREGEREGERAREKVPVLCTFPPKSFNLLYGNQNYCKKK